MAGSAEQFQVTFRVDQTFAAPARTIKKVYKVGLMMAVRHWHKVMLPLHFLMTAYHRYAGGPDGLYKRRHSAYRRSGGLTRYGKPPNPRPLYEVGLTESTARVTPEWDNDRWTGFSGTSVRARVKFTVPTYILAIRKFGYKPMKELTTVNRQEVRALSRIVDRHAEAELKRPQGYMVPLQATGQL